VAASQIEAAQAALKSAAAQTEQARLDVSYCDVVAAEAGTVTHKNVSPGDYVQVGQNLIALVPLKVWITANFKETQLENMRVGQPVEIRVDAYPGTTFHGHVDSFQHGSGPAFSLLPPENATGNYVKVVQRIPVKIVFDDPPDPQLPLGPGMSVLPTVKVR
jgi:membrane fusion protein (multidrug efflux system)